MLALAFSMGRHCRLRRQDDLAIKRLDPIAKDLDHDAKLKLLREAIITAMHLALRLYTTPLFEALHHATPWVYKALLFVPLHRVSHDTPWQCNLSLTHTQSLYMVQ